MQVSRRGSRDLGTKMELETKGRGYSIDECCEALMDLEKTYARLDDPFSNWQDGGARVQPSVDHWQGAGGGGLGHGGKGGGRGVGKQATASAPTTAPTAVRAPYFDGDCSHYGKRGHRVTDCRNRHLPAVKRDQGHGQGDKPSRKVATAFSRLTIEE